MLWGKNPKPPTNQEPNIVIDIPFPEFEGGMKVCKLLVTYKHFYQDTGSLKVIVPSSKLTNVVHQLFIPHIIMLLIQNRLRVIKIFLV